MIKSIYATSDNTIYEKTGSLNAGLDSLLELSKVSSSAGIFTSRMLINFQLDSISASIAAGDITNPSFYINLYSTNVKEAPLEYALIAHPLSQSWSNGVGRILEPISQNGYIKDGSSWIYRDKQDVTTKYVATKDTQWTSQSLVTGTEIKYSSVTGGGTWYSNYYGTQSFEQETSDLRMNVTPVINYILSTKGANGKYINDGIIIMRSGSQETDAKSYGNISFFSRETNTVYQPRLEVVYDDSEFNSSGLNELTSDQSVLYVKNLKHEYTTKERPKIRVIGRDRYPSKTFSTQSNYKTINFLPTSSYYGVKDALTEEFILPYSSVGTKLSCDSGGNFFKLDMDSFMPERYYKLSFQVTQSDASVVVYDENFYFKVVR